MLGGGGGMTSMSCMFSNKVNSVVLHGVGWKEEGKLYHISNINGHTIQSKFFEDSSCKSTGNLGLELEAMDLSLIQRNFQFVNFVEH